MCVCVFRALCACIYLLQKKKQKQIVRIQKQIVVVTYIYTHIYKKIDMRRADDDEMMHVGVFVLGELGRSPRMQYHTLSLASTSTSTSSRTPHHVQVHAIGLSGAQVHPQIVDRENIHLHLFSDALWSWLPGRTSLPDSPWFRLLWFLFVAPLKVAIQCAVITAYLMWYLPHNVRYLLVQNPPSIPTLVLVQMVCLLFKRRCRLVVDWHNFGYSLLDVKGPSQNEKVATAPGETHRERLVVRVARWIEMSFGRYAHHHFCVSKAMQHVLSIQWGIKATVLYDRPPAMFREVSLLERHALYERVFGAEESCSGDNGRYSSTLFTKCTMGDGSIEHKVSLRDDRPVLIVSSTSWTPDEDFQILLDAIEILEQTILEDNIKDFPRLEFIITGRGPQKAMYERKIASMHMRNCNIRTAWLRAEDYPLLLASSDLGVCLHFSSSGVDLPMKIVDMFGSGLPVCAIGYKTLPELVLHGENGYIFDNSEQLARHFLVRSCDSETAVIKGCVSSGWLTSMCVYADIGSIPRIPSGHQHPGPFP